MTSSPKLQAICPIREKKLRIDPATGPAPLRRDITARSVEDHVRGRSDNRLFLWNYWLLSQMNLH